MPMPMPMSGAFNAIDFENIKAHIFDWAIAG